MQEKFKVLFILEPELVSNPGFCACTCLVFVYLKVQSVGFFFFFFLFLLFFLWFPTDMYILIHAGGPAGCTFHFHIIQEAIANVR